MRKEKTLIVPEGFGDNRDKGKIFKITEMSAAQAEKWAFRAFLALSRSGVEIPQNVRGIGIVGILIIGINIFLKGNLQYPELEPLLEEMMGCVKMQRDPKHDFATPIINDDDIQEVPTRLWLRQEVLALHVNFTLTEALSKFWTEVTASAPTAASLNTQTSPLQ